MSSDGSEQILFCLKAAREEGKHKETVTLSQHSVQGGAQELYKEGATTSV